jgi:hypothetical protein
MSNTGVEPTRARVSRRGVIKAGLLGTAALALGGVGLALRQGVLMESLPAGLRVLNQREYSVLTVIADRLCPAMGEGAPGARALDVASMIDRRLASAEADMQGAIKLLLNLFENALTGALFGERFKPFTQLDPAAQDRVLTQWRASTVGFRRSAFGALNGLVASTYYGDPRTWKRIGYDGPPSPQALRVGFSMNLVDYESLRPSTQPPPKG